MFYLLPMSKLHYSNMVTYKRSHIFKKKSCSSSILQHDFPLTFYNLIISLTFYNMIFLLEFSDLIVPLAFYNMIFPLAFYDLFMTTTQPRMYMFKIEEGM